MVAMRKIGNGIRRLAEEQHVANSKICELLRITDAQLERVYFGRTVLQFEHLKTLAKLFNVQVHDLLHPDEEYYQKHIVHCMTDFDNPNNLEDILNLVDGYIDVVESVS